MHLANIIKACLFFESINIRKNPVVQISLSANIAAQVVENISTVRTPWQILSMKSSLEAPLLRALELIPYSIHLPFSATAGVRVAERIPTEC